MMRAMLVLQSFSLVVMTAGFVWFGSSIKSLKQGDTINVTGAAEKIVSMDSVELQITIDNKGENAIDLYKKRVKDRNKVLQFVREYGINDQSDRIEMTTINSPQGEVKQNSWIEISRDKNFSSEDKITIYSKNIAVVKNIMSVIDDLSSEDMTVTAKCKYHMENEDEIRGELMKEAVKDAKGIAETLISALGKKITGVRKIEYDKVEFVSVSGSKNSDPHYYHYYGDGKDNSQTRKAIVRVKASFSHD